MMPSPDALYTSIRELTLTCVVVILASVFQLNTSVGEPLIVQSSTVDRIPSFTKSEASIELASL